MEIHTKYDIVYHNYRIIISGKMDKYLRRWTDNRIARKIRIVRYNTSEEIMQNADFKNTAISNIVRINEIVYVKIGFVAIILSG